MIGSLSSARPQNQANPAALSRSQRRGPAPKSALEETMAVQLRAAGLSAGVEREYRFDGKRRWRFDFAWPEAHIALECEGGIHSGGRHTRGAGYEADLEKYNAAALRGWLVLRFSKAQIMSGKALQLVERALSARKPA